MKNNKKITKEENTTFLKEQVEILTRQTEILKAQLMNTSLINELTKVLHTTTDPKKIIHTILLGIQEIVGLDRVILFEIDNKNFKLVPKSSVGVEKKILDNLKIPIGFEGGEITDAIFLNRHFLIDNPDENFDIFYKELNSTSYLVIPFVSKVTRICKDAKNCQNSLCPAFDNFNPYCWSINGSGNFSGSISEDDRRKKCISCSNFKIEGVFWMDRTSSKGAITSDHITTLTTMLSQAGTILENFRMFNALETANNDLKVVNNDLRVAQTKINKDLEHARAIQRGLLPENIPNTKDLSVVATYIPADAVGGDYYDVFEIDNGVYGIIVADVSGHGVASALIMSMVKVLLKTYADKDVSAQKTLERINKIFLSEIHTDNFVTVFYGILNTNTHVLNYTSGGHCPILIFDKKENSFKRIKADGLFLGIFPDMMLEESFIEYKPGNVRMILYTDGLTEAKNKNDEMYEMDRLEHISQKTIKLTPKKALKEILDSQIEFCGENHEPADDITVLVIDF